MAKLNKLKPDNQAEDDHTTFLDESNIPGEIRNANDNEIPKRNKRLNSE